MRKIHPCEARPTGMFRLILPFAALTLLSLSGCCEYLGLCASASVHTSIDAPTKYAQQDTNGTLAPAELPLLAQAPTQPSTCSD